MSSPCDCSQNFGRLFLPRCLDIPQSQPTCAPDFQAGQQSTASVRIGHALLPQETAAKQQRTSLTHFYQQIRPCRFHAVTTILLGMCARTYSFHRFNCDTTRQPIVAPHGAPANVSSVVHHVGVNVANLEYQGGEGCDAPKSRKLPFTRCEMENSHQTFARNYNALT
jgi:hypothetical protein